jgi:DNA modification methylase
MAPLEPYYEDGTVTIYHGEAGAILPDITADVLLTDPPYGVGLGIGKDMRASGHGLAKRAFESGGETYEDFCAVVVPAIKQALRIVKRGAVFTGPHLQELPKADAIGGIYCPAGSGRHRWGFKTFLPVMFYGTDPTLNRGARPNTIVSTSQAQSNGHPCPKPIEWMHWLVQRVTLPGEVILDPFAGSGTSFVGCLCPEGRSSAPPNPPNAASPCRRHRRSSGRR